MPREVPIDSQERGEYLRSESELLQFHMLQENAKSFQTIARYVRRSFQTTYLMNVALFLIGIAAFVAAILKGYYADNLSEAAPALIYGGLSVTSFVVAFVLGPIRSIERDSIYVTWLLTVFNTYLYRVVYLRNPETVDQDLVSAEKDLIDGLKGLIDKQSAAANGSVKKPEETTSQTDEEGSVVRSGAG